MKFSAMNWLALTTLILATVAIFASMNLAFNWIFYLTVLGQAILIVTVYRILKDDYQTDKTFENFYEDHPIPSREGPSKK